MMWLDDSPIPGWRTLGVVTTVVGDRMFVGDPCYGGLDLVERAALAPGRWLWQVRDQAAGGGSTREFEVRAVHESISDIPASWEWLDEFGLLRDCPTVPPSCPGTAVDLGSRDVDSGRMQWQITSLNAASAPQEWAEWETNQVTGDGRCLQTDTGWGDGVYPVAGVLHDGMLMEVRMCFITPEPARLSPQEFQQLARVALSHVDPGVGDTVEVRLEIARHAYQVKNDGDPDDIQDREYDTVMSVDYRGRVFYGTDTRSAYHPYRSDESVSSAERDVLLVSRLASVWGRLPREARAGIVTSEDVLTAVTDREATGWIVSICDSDVRVTVAV